MTKTGEAARPAAAIKPESLLESWLLYQKQIVVAAIVVAVAAGGYWLWSRSAEIKEGKAAVAYQQAEEAYGAGNPQLAQGDLEKASMRYAGTSSGTQASMLLAQILFDQGKYEEGIAALDATEDRAPRQFQAGIQALVGSGHEAAGQAAQAALAYGRASQLADSKLDQDMYRMEQARNLVASGDTVGAARIYGEIGNKDDSPFAGESRIRRGEIAVK